MIIPKSLPPIIKVAEMLELRLEPAGDELRCRCPNPDHLDENPSCYINPEKNVWCCYGCGRGGDAASLYAIARGCSREDAEEILWKLDGAGQSLPPFAPLRDDSPIDAAYTFCSIMKDLGQRGEAVPPSLLMLLEDENPTESLRRFITDGDDNS